jgi:predicted permease
MAAAMFMNSNSLPIALMQSLVVTVPGLKWGQDDNEDAMIGRALTYLVLYSTLGMVVSLALLNKVFLAQVMNRLASLELRCEVISPS